MWASLRYRNDYGGVIKYIGDASILFRPVNCHNEDLIRSTYDNETTFQEAPPHEERLVELQHRLDVLI